MKDIYLSLLIGFFFGIQIRMVYRWDRDDEIYYLASFLHNFFTPCRFLLSRIRGALCIIKDLTCIWKIIGFTLNTSTSLSVSYARNKKKIISQTTAHWGEIWFSKSSKILHLYFEKLSWWQLTQLDVNVINRIIWNWKTEFHIFSTECDCGIWALNL